MFLRSGKKEMMVISAEGVTNSLDLFPGSIIRLIKVDKKPRKGYY